MQIDDLIFCRNIWIGIILFCGIAIAIATYYATTLQGKISTKRHKQVIGTLNTKIDSLSFENLNTKIGSQIDFLIEPDSKNKDLTTIVNDPYGNKGTRILKDKTINLRITAGDHSYFQYLTDYSEIKKDGWEWVTNFNYFPKYKEDKLKSMENGAYQVIPDKEYTPPYKISMIDDKLLFNGKIRDFKTGELLGWFSDNEFEVTMKNSYSFNKDSSAIEIIDKYGYVCFQVQYEKHSLISKQFHKDARIKFKGYFKHGDHFYIFNDKVHKVKSSLVAEKQIKLIEEIFVHIGKDKIGKRKQK